MIQLSISWRRCHTNKTWVWIDARWFAFSLLSILLDMDRDLFIIASKIQEGLKVVSCTRAKKMRNVGVIAITQYSIQFLYCVVCIYVSARKTWHKPKIFAHVCKANVAQFAFNWIPSCRCSKRRCICPNWIGKTEGQWSRCTRRAHRI